jgi:hypothetical protein
MEPRKFGWVMVGMALGVAGLTLLTRRHKESKPWDVEGVLRACDRAAERLESLIQTEQPGTTTASA